MEFEPNFSPEKNKEQEKTDKEKEWEEIMKNIEETVDKLGMKVDEGIKEAVAAFQAHEFPTSGSCEGHIDKEHGLEYPWVEVYPTLDKKPIEMTDEEKEKALREKQEYRKKMTDLLSEFYKDRDVEFKYMLNFRSIGYGFRVQSTGAENSEVINHDKTKKRYKKMKKEMDDFTKFLKDKYFNRD